MIFRDPSLKFRDLFKQEPSLLQESLSYRIEYTALARQALYKALDFLEIQEGEDVLVPAYICKEAVIPLELKKINPQYYRIKRDFTIDFEDLAKKVTQKTKAILCVSYFGLTDQREQCLEFSKKYNLHLIEDNAHTLINDLTAIKGEVAVFSLRKMYPIANGALLMTPKETGGQRHETQQVRSLWGIDDYHFVISRLLRNLYSSVSSKSTNSLLLNYKNKKKNRMSHGGNDFLENQYAMLRSSIPIISNTSIKDVFEARCENFGNLLKQHNGISHKIPLDQLQKDFCPLALPLIIEKNREHFMNQLFLNGYVVYSWSDLPATIEGHEDYMDENYLAQTVVLVPIHQSLNTKKINRLAELIKGISNDIAQ